MDFSIEHSIYVEEPERAEATKHLLCAHAGSLYVPTPIAIS